MDIQSGATVELAGSGSFASAMSIANAGTLRFNQSGDYTLMSNIMGTGDVVKTGTSKLTLNAGNMSGNFIQQQGDVELAAGRTWTGNYTQHSGTFIADNGTTITGNADFFGTIAPDTLTIGGDAIFRGGSVYVYTLDTASKAHSLIAVAGNVEIENNATLDIVLSSGGSVSGTFNVITASHFNGNYFNVPNTWGTEFEQGITGNTYWIHWASITPDFADNTQPFASSNAYGVALGMDKIYADGLTGNISDLYDTLSNMSSSDPQGLADAFAQLHGEVFAASQMNLVNMQRGFLNRIPSARYRLWNDRNGIFLGQSPCEPCAGVPAKWNRWGTFTGDWLERKSVGTYSGYDLRGAGVVVGLDRNISRNSFGGVAFAYDNANQNFKTIRSNNQIDAFRTVFYGGMKSGKTYADGYAGYTKNWNKTRRDISIGTFEGVARSRFDDDMFSTGFEVGRKLSFGNGRVTPSIGLHYIHLSSPKVTESGASDANLLVHSSSYNSLRLPVGVKFSQDSVGYGGIIWTPEARMFYIRELADASVRTGTSFATVSSIPFYAESGNWGRNSARLGVGLNAALSDWLNFRIDYDYEVYDHTTANWFGTTLGVRW